MADIKYYDVILKPVIPPGGGENPVADIHHVKQTPEFLFA